MRRLTFLLPLVFSCAQSAFAQNTTADLKLTLVDPPTPNAPGSLIGSFSFRAENLGPETAGLYAGAPALAVFIFATAVDILPDGPEMEFRALDPINCPLYRDVVSDPPPGEPAKYQYMHLPGPMAPNTSIYCPVEYEILPSLDYPLPITWKALAIRTDDPVSTNNAFTLIFNAQPRQIPAMTPMGLVAFALALVGAFIVVRRRALDVFDGE